MNAGRLIFAWGLALVLAAGCGDDGPRATRHEGTLALPAALAPTDVRILTPSGEVVPAPDGTFSARSPAGAAPWTAIAALEDGTPVAVTLVDPATRPVALSCGETALSLVVLRSALFALPPAALGELLPVVRARPATATLAEAVCAALEADPRALAAEDGALATAVEAAATELSEHLASTFGPGALSGGGTR